MTKKTLFIIGKPFSEYTNSINRKHYNLIMLLDSSAEEKNPESFDKTYKINFSSKTEFLSSLKEITERPDGILALYENYVVARSWASEYYKMDDLSENSALAATNKILMRQKFFDYDPSITPLFSKVNRFEDIKDFTNKYGFPVMIKPGNLSKSLLVYKCNSLEEARNAYTTMTELFSKIYKKYNIYDKSGEIIVEQYLKGTMHTVAAFTNKKGEVFLCDDIVDNITASDIGKDDNYLYLRSIPSKLGKKQQKEILAVSKKGMKALGLKGTAGHVELFYTSAGPKIIEIGARLGGYRSRMYKLASGVDLVKADISAATGSRISLKKKFNNYCSVFEIFPDNEGMFKKVSNYEKIPNLATFYSMKLNVKDNEPIGQAKNGYKFTLNIVLKSESKAKITKDINFIKNNVKIETL